ncbi:MULTISPECIES: GNAT family N-acetyltransferase [Microbacterium]|uniref:GNAT family N-acetyltransferase n=1 Tax=Microbacterium TaxID=33882 RepID=UPI002857DF67|nr:MULTISPECIES: GNAT family N-acetyltransferase [Microbacterium]MDR7112234.1 GNAT superfamily N-acetyltransferase [Microbacterium trichothecenolyticum]MDT0143048.1 GNAT family N-acetyltransferase [Microbacterium sp. PRC9]
MTGVVVRNATTEDAAALAVLKVAWAGRPNHPGPEEMRSFSNDIASWMTAEGDSLIARVAERDGALVGMAWLVIFDRVPDFHDRSRSTGDIQSVFVLPEFRQHGVGRALVDSLLEAADERGILRVTVSANEAAAQLYVKAGFRSAPLLLERRLDRQDVLAP